MYFPANFSRICSQLSCCAAFSLLLFIGTTLSQAQTPPPASQGVDDVNGAGSSTGQTGNNETRPIQNPDPVSDNQRIMDEAFGQAANAEFNLQIQTIREDIAIRQERAVTAEVAQPNAEQLAKLYGDALQSLKDAEKQRTEAARWILQAKQAALALGEQPKSSKPELPRELEQEFDRLSFEEAQIQQQKIQALLADAQNQVSELSGKIAFREDRRKELPGLISDAQERATKKSSSVELDDTAIQEAAGWKQQATRLFAQQERLSLEGELKTYETEATLLPSQLDRSKVKEMGIQEALNRLQDSMSKKRASRISKFRSQVQAAGLPNTELFDRIRYLLNLNPPQSSDAPETDKPLTWFDLAQKQDGLKVKLDNTQAELQRWSDLRDGMKTRLEPDSSDDNGPGSNRWVVERLRKQRSELPQQIILSEELRTYQEAVEQAESLDYDVSDLANQLLVMRSQDKAEVADRKSLEVVAEVLSAIKGDLSQYLSDLYALADLKQQTIELSKDYQSFIDRQLLWTPNASPLTFADIGSASAAAVWFLDAQNWKAVASLLVNDFWSYPYWYLLLVAGISLLIFRRVKLQADLQKTSKKAERKTCTDFTLSMQGLLQTLLISAPFPIVLLFIGWRLHVCCQLDLLTGFPPAFAKGLLLATGTLFPMSFLRQVCVQDGLGISHFDWRERETGCLHYHLRWLIDFSVPLLIGIGVYVFHSEVIWEKSLGRMAFLVLMIMLAIFLGFILHPTRGVFSSFLSSREGGWFERLKFIWYPAAIMVPVALAVLSFLGYHYTAQQLAARLDTTLWMIISLTVVYCLLKRWLLLKRRQMMMQQARERLEAAQREQPSEIPRKAVETDEVNLASVSEQTRRLVTSAFVFGGLVLAFLIWADVLPAISMLDSIVLWTVQGDMPDDRVPITLSNLLLVIPILVLTTVATRNVPGLLEIAILQYLPLTKAVRYAITTLARYAIAALGIGMAAYWIGLKWSSIQWLVAGLGVGLGFGLQEIVANFISGIILLFEQPIRVGDVVTIDGTTGTVAKIRIRATTIVNWDRQELIVPNKELITGKLINWTLSDTTNRVVVNVGVAYGSDSKQACEIVREVCGKHPNIMTDPAPIVTFEGFGDNTLNLVLRAYLSTLDNRLSTLHELHEQIYIAFNDAGIEIAFPQRDLHLRSVPEPFSKWLGNQVPPVKSSPVS